MMISPVMPPPAAPVPGGSGSVPPATLTGLLAARAAEQPRRLAVAFLGDDGTVDEITAERFHREALAFAAALAGIGVAGGDLVILVLPHSRTLLSAFWGAMYAGAVPSIFPFLTEKLDPALYFERVRLLVAGSGARAVITSPEFEAQLQDLIADLPCRLFTTAAVRVEPPGDLDAGGPVPRSPDDIAFLQHSSGTTGLQKGVALSHRAVQNQIADYGAAIRLAPDDVVVSWLPLYHDMGLIAGFVMPLAAGIPLVLMSPFAWVRDPASLLRAVHAYRGTLCWLPNFAYNHIARNLRPRDLAGLDLSMWRAVVNCSEPARHESHVLFLDRLAPAGLRETSLAVSYAMAENTFAVTQTRVGAAPRVDWVDRAALQTDRVARPMDRGAGGAVAVVSCGAPIPGTELRIAGDAGDLPERAVGEILVRGRSMLTEYYRRPDLTADAIQGGWYRTGDMGYLADGELYVSGRKKDLIIVGGKNIYPQDLEAAANRVAGLAPGRSVAFGVADERLGSESIVMVCELAGGTAPHDAGAIELDLRRRVTGELDITLGDVMLVPGRWIVKTSSGKLARSENRRKYLAARRPER